MLMHKHEYCFDMYTGSYPTLYHMEEHFLEDGKDTYIVMSSQGTLKIYYDYAQDAIEIHKIDNNKIHMKSMDDKELEKYIYSSKLYESSSQFTIDAIINIISTLINEKYFSSEGAMSIFENTTTYSTALYYPIEETEEDILIGFVRIHATDNDIQTIVIDATDNQDEWNKNRGISENYEEKVYDNTTYSQQEDVDVIAQNLSDVIHRFIQQYENSSLS